MALAPSVHPQFLTSTGQPLSGGFIYTYAAGTTTNQATYTDVTGTIQNANPIPLDATGAPSNGSGSQTGIWLTNQSYKFCAYNSALVLQWCTDNVNAYQVLNNINAIVFGSLMSDPSAVAGQIWYRSDIPCLRLFTTFADCLVTLTAPQNLTNKTLDISLNTLKTATNTAGHYPRNNGTQYIDGAIQGADLPPVFSSTYPNNASGTGTALLAKLTGAPSSAITATTTDSGGIIGICIGGCGTSGSSQISTVGQTPCIFDGATTAGDYVQISTTIAGNCHDVGGGGYPSTGQVIGRVLSTNGAAGTFSVDLFPSEIRSPLSASQFPTIVYNTISPATNTAIAAMTMVTPTTTATYRFGGYITQTALGTGCTGNTAVTMQVVFTDPLASSATTLASAPLVSITNNGTVGTGFTLSSAIYYIRAKAGTPIQVAVQYIIGTGCSIGPSYQAFPILEQVTAN